MTARWFRVYDDLVDDPKVQMLPDRTFRALINLWCLASRNDGELPTPREIAFSLRMKVEKVNALLDDLKLADLIDDDPDGLGIMRPHNWDARQFKSDVTDPTASERQKRYRDRHRNGSAIVTPTVTETHKSRSPESETETEQNQKVTRPSPLAGGPPSQDEFALTGDEAAPPKTNGASHHAYPEEFESVWHEYLPIAPKNATKADAFASWKKLSAGERGLCWSGVVNYAVWVLEERKKRSDVPVKHLATFINKRGWESFQEPSA